MNDHEELVIRYLSGEMSGDELLTFKLQQNNSEELRKLIGEYSSVYDKINKQSSVEGNYFYFENILQNFYNRKSSVSKKGIIKNLVYASIILVFVSISYVLFNNQQVDNVNDLNIITQGVNEDEILNLIEEFSLVENVDFNLINSNSVIEQQINSFYYNSIQNIERQLEISDLTYQLTESESEQIYSELINMKIL